MVSGVAARASRFLTFWRLSRAISRKPVPRFVIVAERRSEGLAALLAQLLITEDVPAALHFVPMYGALEDWEVVVPQEHAARAREVMIQYGEPV